MIANDHNTDPPIPGEIANAANLRRRYPLAFHRPTPVCYTYNCHGLTFAARRTEITAAAEVRKILAEDAYTQVHNRAEVSAGDIVIYIAPSGDIEHSGIVVDNDPVLMPRVPKVLSKWGSAHEVIHPYNYGPYSLFVTEFHRVNG